MKEKLKNILNEITKAGFMACGSPPDISANMAKRVVGMLDDFLVTRKIRKEADGKEENNNDGVIL